MCWLAFPVASTGKDRVIKMIKRDCGEHWGHPRPDGDNHCDKCAYIGKHRAEHPECYQAGGTPFIALLGDVVKANARLDRQEEAR
jgi:hypothetical protein